MWVVRFTINKSTRLIRFHFKRVVRLKLNVIVNFITKRNEYTYKIKEEIPNNILHTRELS